MKSIAVLYDDLSDAYRAIQELAESGIDSEDINLVAGDLDRQYSEYLEQEDMKRPKMGEEVEGAAAGGALGGLAGLLLGLGALTIPGIGPIIAAGPLVTGLMGAIVGGLTGAIINWGIPEEEARLYSEAVRRGGALVIVRAPEGKAGEVAAIVDRHNPVDVEARAAQWEEDGGRDASAT